MVINRFDIDITTSIANVVLQDLTLKAIEQLGNTYL